MKLLTTLRKLVKKENGKNQNIFFLEGTKNSQKSVLY